MAYFINFCLVIAYYIVFRLYVPQHYRKIFAVTVCIHAVLFRALADPFNFVDTSQYVPAFKVISSFSFRQILTGKLAYIDWGYGFVLLNWLVGLFTRSPYILYSFFAVLGITPVVWYYYKTSHALFFTILMFLAYPMLYRMGFGVIRQHLSIAYLLPALYYIEKPKKSVCFALIATSLHTSSVLFFLYYAWRYLYARINSRQMKILFMTGAAILLRIMFSAVASAFARYSSYATAEGSNNFSPALLIGLFVLFVFINYHYLVLEKADNETVTFLCFGFSMAVGSIGLPLGRFTLMFMYVLCSAFTIFMKYKCGSLLKYSVWIAALIAVMLWQFREATFDDYELWILK